MYHEMLHLKHPAEQRVRGDACTRGLQGGREAFDKFVKQALLRKL
jgi:hypothetical protein